MSRTSPGPGWPPSRFISRIAIHIRWNGCKWVFVQCSRCFCSAGRHFPAIQAQFFGFVPVLRAQYYVACSCVCVCTHACVRLQNYVSSMRKILLHVWILNRLHLFCSQSVKAHSTCVCVCLYVYTFAMFATISSTQSSVRSNEKYRAVETIKTIRNVDIKLNEGKMVFQCEKSAYSSLKMVLLVFFFFFL